MDPNIDALVKGPKFRHACEGRHPELFENKKSCKSCLKK